MMGEDETESVGDEPPDQLMVRYADDPLKYRLLLRLYSAASAQRLKELAEPLRVHPANARKSLRVLVSDGLVVQRGGGAGIYSLSPDPSARALVTRLLSRVIEPGAAPSSSIDGARGTHG